MDWQPIETAPKDGTVVLLAGCRKPVAAAWLEDEIDYWHVDDNKRGPFALRGPGPTHWMPFPAPPESTQRRGKRLPAHADARRCTKDCRRQSA